ncbi:DoxX family protein [Colwellia sp. D2M02]|uniref:DoxX family protein n=1 Tax=Colwellia asteriadis TaxID=517723 RepID=A0ABN1L6X0_9GAMM|nr:DoxX family protein [Colwellia sp. D2M02]MBU2892473.1 DoxX family protein [Colwellia sp. D2M02]
MVARISSYILALIFFASGGAKLLSLPFEIEAFVRWGYPIEFMYLTGIIEVFGALGLLITRLSSLSALCLGGFMLGAIGTHFVHKEWLMLTVASLIMLTAFWRAWSGREEIKQFIIRQRNQ